MNSKIICALSTEGFRNAAYADYLADVATTYSELVTMVSAAAESMPEDESGQPIEIEQRILEIMGPSGIDSEAQIPFNEGYITMHDLLYYTMTATDSYSDISIENGSEYLDKKIFPIHKFVSDVTDSFSYNDIVSEIKNTLHSTVCTMSALTASLKESVSDRLQVYKDTIAGFFSDVYNDLTGSFDYFKQMLQEQANSASTIGNSILTAMNVIGRDDNYEDDSILTSKLYEYTGASPIPALDFSNVKNAITSTARVVAKATADIAKGIWNAVKPVFKKVVKAVSDVINVNDLEVVNKDSAALSVDGWVLEENKEAKVWSLNSDEKYIGFFNKYSGKWIKFETIFGELLMYIQDYRKLSVAWYGFDVIMKVKPYPVNYKTVAKIASELGYTLSTTAANLDVMIQKGTTSSYDDYATLITKCAENPDLYLDEFASETEFYQAYQTGYIMLEHALNAASHEMYWSNQYYSQDWQNIGIPEIKNSVTNADFIQLLSGWDKNVSTPTFDSSNVPGIATLLINPNQISASNSYQCPASAILNMFALQYQDRQINPLSWTFIPYRNNVADFLSSRYGVKTDTANQKALTTLITVTVLVVITIVVAVTLKIAISKIKKKAFFKRLEFQGRMDNMMWNGGTMTAKERRRYIRYSRKLNSSNLLTSGLNNTCSPSNFFPSDDTLGIDSVTKLIAG